MSKEPITLLSQSPPLMHLKLLFSPLGLHCRIAPRPGIVQLHRLVEQVKALHLL